MAHEPGHALFPFRTTPGTYQYEPPELRTPRRESGSTSLSDYLRSRTPPNKPRSDIGGDSLAAHTPTPEYFGQSVKRRALELLGAKAGVVNALAPLPYRSQYPFSPKVLDAIITLAIDPIVKPASLRGNLDRMPALRKLSGELATRGFFRRYPGGGIGIGGGGGEGSAEGTGGPAGDATSPGTESAPSLAGSEAIAGFTSGEEAEAALSAAGIGPAAGAADEGVPGQPVGANLAAAARASRPTLGDVGRGIMSTNPLGSAISAALAALSSLLGIGVPGLGAVGSAAAGTAQSQAQSLAAQLGISPEEAMAALTSMAQESAASLSSSGLGSAQGAPEAVPGMTSTEPAVAPTSAAAPVTISPATRANAAARFGGGISPAFLEALESLRTGA
jgi:hypothetical protein